MESEGGVADLQCPEGLTNSSIEFASYGTPEGTCGDFTEGACHAESSTGNIETYCLGEESCLLAAIGYGSLGDPCGGVIRRMYIQATCSN